MLIACKCDVKSEKVDSSVIFLQTGKVKKFPLNVRRQSRRNCKH